MNYLLKVFIIASISTFVAETANALEVVVVANVDQKTLALSKRDLRDVFMGNKSVSSLTPIAMVPSSETRRVFNTKVIGLTESRIQSYWAQMRFSGRKKPPKELESVAAVLTTLINTENSVAYLPADTEIPDGMVVVYRSE